MKSRENIAEKKQSPRISPLELAACNKQINRCKTILKVGKLLADEYLGNRDFYNDMIRFNCNNGIKAVAPINRRVCHSNPPPEAMPLINQVYAKFKGLEYSDMFARLGIQSTSSNNRSPVEAKWVMAYYRKFGTYAYSEQNRITLRDILH